MCVCCFASGRVCCRTFENPLPCFLLKSVPVASCRGMRVHVANAHSESPREEDFRRLGPEADPWRVPAILLAMRDERSHGLGLEPRRPRRSR